MIAKGDKSALAGFLRSSRWGIWSRTSTTRTGGAEMDTVKKTYPEQTQIKQQSLPTYTIGCFPRKNDGDFGEYEAFVGSKESTSNNMRSMIVRATVLAFGHACTGPTEGHRKTGAHYQVRDDEGDIIFSIKVTVKGRAELRNAAAEQLKKNRRVLRQWANTDYTINSDALLSGDTQFIVQRVAERIAPGQYVFDGLPSSSTMLYLAGLLPNAIAELAGGKDDRQG